MGDDIANDAEAEGEEEPATLSAPVGDNEATRGADGSKQNDSARAGTEVPEKTPKASSGKSGGAKTSTNGTSGKPGGTPNSSGGARGGSGRPQRSSTQKQAK